MLNVFSLKKMHQCSYFNYILTSKNVEKSATTNVKSKYAQHLKQIAIQIDPNPLPHQLE